MSSNRIYLGLSALLLVILTGAPALGQDHELQGMQLFEPSDVRPYGNWAQPKEGFFFNFDGLFWYITAPNKTSIGDPTETPTVYYGPNESDSITEFNSMDTGRLRAKWKTGDRIELGYVNGHHGFLISSMELNRQTQHLAGADVFVVFRDPEFGPAVPPSTHGPSFLQGVVGTIFDPITGITSNILQELPVNFTHLSAINRTKVEGVEALYMYRCDQLHRGGTLELLAGARYLSFNDDFAVTATGGALADSNWDTDAQNRIVGPEIGLRWNQPVGRFALSTEGRFMAGVNTQSIHQTGLMGSNLLAPNADGLPRLMNHTGLDQSARFTEFSPLIEFRAELHYALTRLIGFKTGFTGVWLNNVARGSDMVDYTMPALGITTANQGNRQDVLMYGFNIGIEVNR